MTAFRLSGSEARPFEGTNRLSTRDSRESRQILTSTWLVSTSGMRLISLPREAFIRSDISDCACSTARGIRARLQPCRNPFAPLC
jgi:hypothetical protein